MLLLAYSRTIACASAIRSVCLIRAIVSSTACSALQPSAATRCTSGLPLVEHERRMFPLGGGPWPWPALDCSW
jgi:hypothetical protein